MTVEKALMTAEELFWLPSGTCRHELLDGVLVTLPLSGARHGYLLGRIAVLLIRHVDTRDRGVVLAGETGIVLRRNPDRVRAPDVCFVAADRLPPEDVPDWFLELMPDLIVEIVSPSDTAAGVQQKTEEWLQAGVRLVWTVYPETRTVAVSQNVESNRILDDSDTLTGEPVLPEFSVPVAALFA
jgi:Uma2 family endonuclease